MWFTTTTFPTQALMEIVETVLQQMSSLRKPQIKFMLMLLPLLMCLRGRVNFSVGA